MLTTKTFCFKISLTERALRMRELNCCFLESENYWKMKVVGGSLKLKREDKKGKHNFIEKLDFIEKLEYLPRKMQWSCELEICFMIWNTDWLRISVCKFYCWNNLSFSSRWIITHSLFLDCLDPTFDYVAKYATCLHSYTWP